jgi:DNA modification methylase
MLPGTLPKLTSNLAIISPKRTSKSENLWEGFFPYYAGFPEAFASSILRTSGLSSESTVLDPWNGSGTTTYAASKLGIPTIGFDINPVMVVVGRARLLAAQIASSRSD